MLATLLRVGLCSAHFNILEYWNGMFYPDINTWNKSSVRMLLRLDFSEYNKDIIAKWAKISESS
jgi:hypothetical protein